MRDKMKGKEGRVMEGKDEESCEKMIIKAKDKKEKEKNEQNIEKDSG